LRCGRQRRIDVHFLQYEVYLLFQYAYKMKGPVMTYWGRAKLNYVGADAVILVDPQEIVCEKRRQIVQIAPNDLAVMDRH
jgi:hypothetical protein